MDPKYTGEGAKGHWPQLPAPLPIPKQTHRTWCAPINGAGGHSRTPDPSQRLTEVLTVSIHHHCDRRVCIHTCISLQLHQAHTRTRGPVTRPRLPDAPRPTPVYQDKPQVSVAVRGTVCLSLQLETAGGHTQPLAPTYAYFLPYANPRHLLPILDSAVLPKRHL